MCKKFGSGPCGEIFKQWLACTDEHPGKDAKGEPLHLPKCSQHAERLAECLDANAEYYDDDNAIGNQEPTIQEESGSELQSAWDAFVKDMEAGIASGKYDMLHFPEEISPTVQVSSATRTGAAFFVPESGGHPLIAAYVLDENGYVVAASSNGDMDMGKLGCVLQFKVAEGTQSATIRAIYDTEKDDVAIFSRTMLLPKSSSS
ncbi:hypothetical protein ACHAXT_008733 [Thalassiosira profunda]